MDAVELPYPVDVAAAAVSKLMGSDGFVGRAGVGGGVVAVKKVEPRGGGDSDRVVGIPAIRPCSVIDDKKGECLFSGLGFFLSVERF